MTKSELTHIIRQIISEEIRKELPKVIAEVFQNYTNKKTSSTINNIQESVNITDSKPVTKPSKFKQNLRELFDGTPVITPQKAKEGPKKFASNPLLNEVLNQTRPFSPQERMGAPSGVAAMMAAAQAGVSLPGAVSAAPMMAEENVEEPSYLRNIPNMVPSSAPQIQLSTPNVSQAQLLRDDHAPLADLPEGVSVLDVKGAIAQTAPEVANALTKNYSQMLKLMDKPRIKRQ